jgi:hypothetical protein
MIAFVYRSRFVRERRTAAICRNLSSRPETCKIIRVNNHRDSCLHANAFYGVDQQIMFFQGDVYNPLLCRGLHKIAYINLFICKVFLHHEVKNTYCSINYEKTLYITTLHNNFVFSCFLIKYKLLCKMKISFLN